MSSLEFFNFFIGLIVVSLFCCVLVYCLEKLRASKGLIQKIVYVILYVIFTMTSVLIILADIIAMLYILNK
jgi:hypothetical protein